MEKLANFINGELFGRVTTVSWGMIFPYGGGLPRHPSQLYEAFLEGIVLFAVLFWMGRQEKIRQRHGMILGAMIGGYGIMRCIVEYFREPDAQIGLMLGYISQGQILSLPMIAAGAALIWYAKKRAAA